MDEIQTLTAQRDELARYIFERNDGALYAEHCRREMEAGRCPYHDVPADTERTVGVCIPCIVKMVGEGTCAPPAPYFSLLAKYHVLATYFVIGGKLLTGRVQSVENGIITFKRHGKTEGYRLEEIDVIVPKEVLRWCQGELNPTTWRSAPADREEIRNREEMGRE